jgi:hypothetical protein
LYQPQIERMAIFTKIIFGFLFTLASFQNYAQGKIDQSKEEIKKGTKTVQGQNSQSSSSFHKNDDRSLGNIIAGGIAQGILYITFYSTIGAYHYEDHLHSNITKYPYYNNQSGNYESTDSVYSSKIHFRFDLDHQFLYSNSNLIGNHFKANIRPFQYFYGQGQYHELTEHNKNGTYSNLSLLTAYVCYDRLRFDRFNFGWKLGMCYLFNNVNKGGLSFGLDAEAFVAKPVSLFISKQWGGINGRAVNQFEVTGKYHIKRYNVHAGYEHLKIASPVYDFAFLGAGVSL